MIIHKKFLFYFFYVYIFTHENWVLVNQNFILKCIYPHSIHQEKKILLISLFTSDKNVIHIIIFFFAILSSFKNNSSSMYEPVVYDKYAKLASMIYSR